MSYIENVRATAERWAPAGIHLSAALFRSVISLLEELDIGDYPTDTVQLYGYVLHSLNKMKADIDFKEAFTRFFYSEDSHSRFCSHMNGELLTPDDCEDF